MNISRDPIIRLKEFVNQEMIVHLLGGKVLTGTLAGFDHLNTVILDKAEEYLR